MTYKEYKQDWLKYSNQYKKKNDENYNLTQQNRQKPFPILSYASNLLYWHSQAQGKTP
jgi:hypothetical protein